MNRPIRRVALVAMLMFGLLLANGTYMTLFRTDSLAAEPQNRRVRDAEFAQDRGAILAAGKTEIAVTGSAKADWGSATPHQLFDICRSRLMKIESGMIAVASGKSRPSTKTMKSDSRKRKR